MASLFGLGRTRSQRPLSTVPRSIIAVLVLCMSLQVAWRAANPATPGDARGLPLPPAAQTLRILSLGEHEALAKALMIWLQAFDNQPGLSIPFSELDYERVIAWLSRIIELDPKGQYPLLAASRVYAEVPRPDKQRRMLEFVHEQFLRAPNDRWQWLAHAVYVAKHRLHDLPLALRYAKALEIHATGASVPHWAQQFSIFVLEDMGELESARILLGGLLASGKISDEHEQRFLQQRLEEMSSNQ